MGSGQANLEDSLAGSPSPHPHPERQSLGAWQELWGAKRPRAALSAPCKTALAGMPKPLCTHVAASGLRASKGDGWGPELQRHMQKQNPSANMCLLPQGSGCQAAAGTSGTEAHAFRAKPY